MNFPLYIVFILLSTVTGFACIRKKAALHLKLLPVFLLVTAIVEICGWWLSTHNTNNTLLYNCYTIGEFSFYIFFLRSIIVNRKSKHWLTALLVLFVLTALTNLFFFQKQYIFNSVTYSIGSLLIVSICIYYFLELFQLPNAINLLKESSFWFCSGLLFFFACDFTLMSLLNHLSGGSSLIIRNIMIIIAVLNGLFYSLITIGFLSRFIGKKKTAAI